MPEAESEAGIVHFRPLLQHHAEPALPILLHDSSSSDDLKVQQLGARADQTARCRMEFTEQQASSLAAPAADHQLSPLRLATFWVSKSSLHPKICLSRDAFLCGSFYLLSPAAEWGPMQALQHLEWPQHFLERLFALSSPFPSRDDADSLTSCRLRPILRHLAEWVHHLEV